MRTTVTFLGTESPLPGATILHALRTGQRYELPADVSRIFVGRDPASPIVIDDDTVSRCQFELHRKPAFWLVCHHPSAKNQTLVNGIPVNSAGHGFGTPLLLGSVIHAGASVWVGVVDEVPDCQLVISGIDYPQFLAVARVVYGSARAVSGFLDIPLTRANKHINQASEMYPFPEARPGPRRRGRAVIRYAANGIVADVESEHQYLRRQVSSKSDE